MATLPDNRVLYIDPYSQAANTAKLLSVSGKSNESRLIGKIAEQPQAIWLTTAASLSIIETLRPRMDKTLVTLVTYFIPGRDRLGGHSMGGAAGAGSYRRWIGRLAAAIGSLQCWIILEPDAVASAAALSGSDAAESLKLLAFAVSELARSPNIRVYLDAGHPRWLSVGQAVTFLGRAGVSQAAGFALNVSNFIATSECIDYGTAIATQLDGKHFIIDTSRNGLGPKTDTSGSVLWCNPDGRALGEPPRLGSDVSQLDGLLWIKRPGESDGTCNGGPTAGEFWPDYALGLAQRAIW